MESTYYQMAKIGFVVLTIACLGFILWGTYLTLKKMGMPQGRAASRTITVGVVLLAWLTAVSIISRSGYFSDFTVMPPRLLPVLLLPLIAILIITFHPAFKRFLAHVPPAWLIYFQVFRVPVEIFLWFLYLDNVLPVQMTFEGRNLDVLTGLTAPLVAYFCYGHGRSRNWLAVVWNLAGLALLANILTIAILSMPTPFRVFMNEPANTIVTYFPIIFLPAVLVPLAYTMHFFSLRRIWIRAQVTEPMTPPASVDPKYTVS